IYVPFVPEPIYPEFLPEDDVLPVEEQLLPVATSPTTESPGYIPESNPEEDPEEDDEEDPEEDPADYPADKGDDRDDEEPSDDDDDDAEEEEHLAPADPAAVAYSADQDPYLAYRVTARMSIRPQAPAPFLSEEVAKRLLALPTPPPSPLSLYSSPLPQIPSPPLPIPLPSCEVGESSAAGAARQFGPTTAEADLYGFTDMLEAAPGRQMSRELGYGIRDTWDDLVGAIQEIAPTTLEGVNQRVIELSSTVDQEDEIIYSHLDDARYDRALLRARVNRLDSDRPFHRRTALLIEEEARLSRAAWARSMDACDQVHSEGISLRTTVMAQQSEITELQAADRRRQAVITDLLKADYRRQRQLVETLKIVKSLKAQMTELQRQQGPAKDPEHTKQSQSYQRRPVAVLRLGYDCSYCTKMAPRGRPTRTTRSRPVTATPPPVTTTPPPVTDPTTTTSVTGAQLQAMIDEGVTAVLAARATTRNGDDSHTSGTGVRRNERTVRECTYQDFMKCQPLFFRGTEGAVNLTQWFERMETVFRISNCTVENQVKFATCTLMGTALTWWNSHARTVTNEGGYAAWSALKKKMTTNIVRGMKSRRLRELWEPKKTDKIEKNTRGSWGRTLEITTQQPNKRQNTGRAYAAGNGDRKPYEGAKPRCPKCNFNHYGPCTPKCTNCKKLGHLAKDCRSRPATANNNNRNNNNNNNRNNNNNNNRNNNNPRAQGANTNAIVCFECGAPGHFRNNCPQWKNKNPGNGNGVARAYAVGVAGQNPDNNVVTVIDKYSPTTLDHGYNVELADGRVIWVNTVLLGCTLNFLNHPFHVDLMPVEMGTYDVIIGMDWLTKNQAVIGMC
ncbi:putative reverse transcriptase domain-containing protein, partial [Tanacetum coccineum]